jgi:hypothetical protein
MRPAIVRSLGCDPGFALGLSGGEGPWHERVDVDGGVCRRRTFGCAGGAPSV